MSKNVQIVCPVCSKLNRVPQARLAEGASCGSCHKSLFSAKPLALDGDSLKRNIKKNDLPLVVDFWAPWCGPCKMMAPAFERAQQQLGPAVRLAKLNTDEYPDAAAPYNIRGIPTLILFKSGREVDRSSGAMSLSQLTGWIGQHI
jgi:thioredoxin 2